MSDQKVRRFHDPKIVPSPGEAVLLTVEHTKEDLRAIDKAVKEGGFWSREEFFRAASADFVKRYRRKNK